jgi:hypothetical protein
LPENNHSAGISHSNFAPLALYSRMYRFELAEICSVAEKLAEVTALLKPAHRDGLLER